VHTACTNISIFAAITVKSVNCMSDGLAGLEDEK
jgi:hypothetical protein